MLEPLDHAKIPNIKNIAPDVHDDAPFDPGRKYCMPYTWLVIGIGYRKSKVEGVPDSWKWLFEFRQICRQDHRPVGRERPDPHLLQISRPLGQRIPPELLKKVEEMLIKQKPNIKAFHADNGQDLLLSGEVDLVMEYNGDIAQVMTEDDDIDFVVPKEGAMNQPDTLASRTARRTRRTRTPSSTSARAEAGAKITETILYPTPNAAAVALMPAELQEQSGDLPAGRDHGQMRVSELSRRRVRACARRGDDAAARGVSRLHGLSRATERPMADPDARTPACVPGDGCCRRSPGWSCSSSSRWRSSGPTVRRECRSDRGRHHRHVRQLLRARSSRSISASSSNRSSSRR